MYANDQVDSDVRLNAKLLDVWEADANQDIYILIRLKYIYEQVLFSKFLSKIISIMMLNNAGERSDAKKILHF